MQEGIRCLRRVRRHENLHRNIRAEKLQQRPQTQSSGEGTESLGLEQTHGRGNRVHLVNFPNRNQIGFRFAGPLLAQEVAHDARQENDGHGTRNATATQVLDKPFLHPHRHPDE